MNGSEGASDTNKRKNDVRTQAKTQQFFQDRCEAPVNHLPNIFDRTMNQRHNLRHETTCDAAAPDKGHELILYISLHQTPEDACKLALQLGRS
jgi:hypothetical protein